jgi:hypothetical protein
VLWSPDFDDPAARQAQTPDGDNLIRRHPHCPIALTNARDFAPVPGEHLQSSAFHGTSASANAATFMACD